MSKSDTDVMSRIDLTDTPDTVVKKIGRAMTDSTHGITFDRLNRPGVSNLVSIYAALMDMNEDEVVAQFAGVQSGVFKKHVSDLIVATLGPVQMEMHRLRQDPTFIDAVLEEGAQRARALAHANFNAISRLVGIHH
jgi:tryptophanyl-tRNA synthetase